MAAFNLTMWCANRQNLEAARAFYRSELKPLADRAGAPEALRAMNDKALAALGL
jgi:hypothetical protein